MDNASKALIMAGGVLIAIMIIGVSLFILSNARGMASDSNKQMEQNAADSFNRFYTSYDCSFAGNDTYTGTISGIDAYNIYKKANDDNWRYEEKRTSEHYIDIDCDESIIDSMDEADGVVNMKKTYTYSYHIGSDGYIDSITISN